MCGGSLAAVATAIGQLAKFVFCLVVLVTVFVCKLALEGTADLVIACITGGSSHCDGARSVACRLQLRPEVCYERLVWSATMRGTASSLRVLSSSSSCGLFLCLSGQRAHSCVLSISFLEFSCRCGCDCLDDTIVLLQVGDPGLEVYNLQRHLVWCRGVPLPCCLDRFLACVTWLIEACDLPREHCDQIIADLSSCVFRITVSARTISLCWNSPIVSFWGVDLFFVSSAIQSLAAWACS